LALDVVVSRSPELEKTFRIAFTIGPSPTLPVTLAV
jgi:hypothetical protein